MSYMQKRGLRQAVHKALRAYHSIENTAENTLAGLMLVQIALANSRSQTPAAVRYATNSVIMRGLTELARKDVQSEEVLRRRFQDRDTIRAVAYKMNYSDDQINRFQAKAITELTAIVWEMEEQCRAERLDDLETRLPRSNYSRLFGVDALVESVETSLAQPDGDGIVTIVGIGGIGKTAIADQVMRRALRTLRYDMVAYSRVERNALASTPPELFSRVIDELYAALPDMPQQATRAERADRLRYRFKARPHLVLLDNLEESAEVAYFFEQLGSWLGTSQFVLTSRARPLTARAASIFMLSELSEAAALELLRYEADAGGLSDFAAAPEDELRAVVELTGGNPLALKLAVGLAHIMPLPTIVADLRQGMSPSTQEMYRRIYWAAWRALSPPARALLEAMPLVDEIGGAPDQLKATAGLDDGALWQAIQELSARSLIEVRGTLHAKRFGIHQLTRTFLHTDIIGWE